MGTFEKTKEWLMKNGYDGLYCSDAGCACEVNDLKPCESIDETLDCEPGYMIDCPNGKNCTVGECAGIFHIVPDKPTGRK